MKKYFTAFPYFEKNDISKILKNINEILVGDEMLTMGKNVENFEDDFSSYCGCKYGVATNSCTVALEIALQCLKLNSGDEVIVPVQTFFATGSCVLRNNAKIVFCDTDNNFLLDFEDLKYKITSKTKAVIIVHFAGLITEKIFEIKNYLKEKNIKLIEDCAHAHGAYILDKVSNKKIMAGSIGDISCFSFFSTKIMTTGEGGMLLCNDEIIYRKAASLRNRGLDTEKNYEDFINIGCNSRFTEIQAILGLSQLKSLENFVIHRNKIADIYKSKLENAVIFQEYDMSSRHAYWRFIAFLKNVNRDNVSKKLSEFGIISDAPYKPLLHLQRVFKDFYKEMKNAERLANLHISLPIHMKISESDAIDISDKLLIILEECKND